MKIDSTFLSGPSGVGKTSLTRVVQIFNSGMITGRMRLHTSRPQRPTEDQSAYHFRSPLQIQELSNDPRYIVNQIHDGTWQAIDTKQIVDATAPIFAEVHSSFLPKLRAFQNTREASTTIKTIALAPDINIADGKGCYAFFRSCLRERGLDDQNSLEKRARSAFGELQQGLEADYRIITPVESSTEQWGDLGTRNGVHGSRKIRTIADLGVHAWLSVEAFCGAVSGRLVPGTWPLRQYRAVLWDYPENEPGGGGPDSTMSYEMLPKTAWTATKDQARADGELLNSETGNDLFVRIEAYPEFSG